MWHEVMENSQIEYEASVLKPNEEATCIMTTCFVIYSGIHYLLKALLQIILMPKNSRNYSIFTVLPGLHRSRTLYGNTIIRHDARFVELENKMENAFRYTMNALMLLILQVACLEQD